MHGETLCVSVCGQEEEEAHPPSVGWLAMLPVTSGRTSVFLRGFYFV